MPIEEQVPPLLEWLGSGFWIFLTVAGAMALLALLFSYLVAAFRHGPMKAGDITYRVLSAAVVDLLGTSPRRIYALARLAVQESMRRRVLSVLAVFVVILVFAAWFLNPQEEPARVHISFVLTATSYLVVLLALFISAFSLPADIEKRTIYTIVTKPVRPSEIVVGRVLGFTVVGTAMLVPMMVLSYFFVTRAVSHQHTVDANELRLGNGVGETSTAMNHRHQVTVGEDGTGVTSLAQSHRHEVTRNDDGSYNVGPHQGMLIARVPVRGDIRFLDPTGQPGSGVNVGNEWEYREYVEGGTPAAAIWTFSPTPEQFPEVLPIEMTIRVYRTYKGDIEQGIRGSLFLKNPTSGRQSEIIFFRARDFEIDRINIPVSGEGGQSALRDSNGLPINLYEDLVDENGNVEVWVQCSERAQYFGMAQADMWLRAGDRPFWLNFFKGHVGIWLQMVLVIAMGVMFSTFLTGTVAMVATIGTIVLGFFSRDVLEMATDVFANPDRNAWGGGPLEAAVRIVRQENLTNDLPDTVAIDVIKMIDQAVLYVMQAMAYALPNFRGMNDASYVAYGFDIPFVDLLLHKMVVAAVYVLGLCVAGYFFLKTREVAR